MRRPKKTKGDPKIEIDPSLIEEAVERVEKVSGHEDRAEDDPEPKSPPKAEESSDSDAGELKERLLRVTADFDNFRKRAQKERIEYMRYANEEIVKELLPVLDNFERALAHTDGASDVSSVRKGIELIFSQLNGVLDRFGVKCESAVGKSFDPMIHEAVSYVPSKEHPPNTVIDEHQKAYYLWDRLVRAALVAVSRGPSESDSAGTSTNDGTSAQGADSEPIEIDDGEPQN